MSEVLKKVKRQVEILAQAIDNTGALKPVDLAERYRCEELTIKRDLKDLRSEGFDLHSERKRGLALSRTIEPRKVKQLIIQYIGLANADTAVDRATSLMVKALKERALVNVVRLQQCIEHRRSAQIVYRKEATEPEKQYIIQPHTLFQSEGYWRVLAGNEGIIKQYHLNKILHVTETTHAFKPIPQEQIEDMFRYSFKSWLSDEQHRIRLTLSPRWTQRIRPMQLMETQVLTERGDGSSLLEATVSSLDEVAAWVVSRGEGVTVEAPEELKAKVVALARGALKNYSSG